MKQHNHRRLQSTKLNQTKPYRKTKKANENRSTRHMCVLCIRQCV